MVTPTTAPVPSTSAADLLYNAERLDEAVNSSSQTYTDRLGIPRLTLTGAIARISGYNNRGSWASSTAYAVTDIALNSGTWYICVVAHTSAASFSTDSASKWRVYQGVIAADLSSTSDAGKGSGQIGYTSSLSYLPGTVGYALTKGWLLNVTDERFAGGAKGDGVTDDTAAMAAAHATGALIYYPPGRYKFSPTISIASGGIVGAGPLLTTLYSADTTTANLIKFTGSLGTYSNIPVFHGFTLEANPSKTTGAGIQVLPSSGETSYADFRNMHTLSCPIGLDFVAASLWKVIGCNFLSYSVAGIQVANTNSPDSGDSVVSDCVFNNPFTTGSGIWQKSSGGLKIVGNKFLGGARGYTLALEGSTSVLIIANNSFENMAQQDIVLAQQTGGTAFVNVCITGNEFSVGDIAVATDATGFLSEVNISANQINMGAVGSNPCIALNSVTDFHIGANLIKGNGGSGSAAISITSCTNGKIGPNTYANLPNPLSITSSPTVSVCLDTQSGTGATASSGWSAYGALYLSPETTITFSRAFLVTPSVGDVSINPTGANGELGAIVVSVSKTQLVVRIVSAVNSIAAAFRWSVGGTL